MIKNNNDEFAFNGEYDHNKNEDEYVFNSEYDNNKELDENEYYWK